MVSTMYNNCFYFTVGQLLLNLGHGIFQKVMEKVVESHGILTSQKCTNLVMYFWSLFSVLAKLWLVTYCSKPVP